MKIAKLLVLGVLFLFGSSTVKAVDANVWQEPAIPTEFASLVNGEVYYFYNVGSQLLFTQGNAWGTQASVGKTGLKVKIELQPEGFYTLTDFVKTQNAWKMWWFVEDGIGMYVDYNNQPDWRWEITDMGNQVYRLSPSVINPTVNDNTKFVGLNRVENPENTALSANCTPDDGSFIDWKLIPEATGDAYDLAMTTYEAAMSLKDVLNQAEAIGANVADQIAVYNNTSSTLEEINAAIEAAKKAILEREEELARENYGNATVDNPIDVTKMFITNYTFDGNKYDGWSGTTFGGYNPKNNAEHYNKTYDTYQNITDLKEGIYKANVHAFYRAGDAQPAYNNYKAQNKESKYAVIYAATSADSLVTPIASPFSAGLTANMTTGSWSTATDEETGETFSIPNNMEAADEFFAAGYCNDNAVLILVKDGNLKIGVRKDEGNSGDWSIFDDFSLTYFGNGDDAYRLMLDSYKSNMKDFSDLGDVIVTQSYVDAYNAAKSAIDNANTKEEITNAINNIQTALADLEKNIELWKEYQALRQEALDCATDIYLDDEYTVDVGDWAEFDSKDVVAKHELTNEELEEEIATIREMIKEAYQHLKPGADVTKKYLVNPDFENSANGWQRDAASGGNVGVGGNSTNHCYEAWNNAKFDIYQVVKSAPKGVYEISVKGFYRYGRTAYQAYLNGEQYTTKETCPVFVYMNANTTPFTNVYGDPVQITDAEFYSGTGTQSEQLEDGTTLYFPNDMASAAIAFDHGMYTQSAYGLVAQEGDQIRIGAKGTSNQLNDSWCIWDDFHLYYRGFQADVVKPVLEQAILDAEAHLNAPIGKDVNEALVAALDEAKAVLDSNDGEAMFAALTKLFDIQEAVNNSAKLFQTLQEANEKLAAAIGSAVASQSVKNEAIALNAAINDGMESHAYNDSDVEDLINQINVMINRLGIPQNMETASDSNPINCTTIIINPAYVDGTDEGWTGGAAVNATANDAEKFNTTFDYFQLLQGLPEGTYKVSVTGFYRAGNAGVDYTSWKENPDANNNAFLYATAGEETVSTPMKRLASQAMTLEALSDGWVWASEEDLLAVPNSMTTAGDAFAADLYIDNNVIVKVGAEGKLTIGLKKDQQITDDWTIWTNWQLFYYGKNSSLEPSGNALGIDEYSAGNIISAEFFSVDGTRVNGLQRGITIVRETLNDGTTRVRKVSLK